MVETNTGTTEIYRTPCRLKGYPVQIVEIDEKERTFKLNEESLNRILSSNGDVKDLPVCVISVAGAFRKGKSFMLNFFLRYLNRKNDDEDWITSDCDENPKGISEPLEGFHWRGGSERDTSGILMWSNVFTSHGVDGKQIAIVLLDTQGAFDSNSTVRECATIFALSTMISSVLVYNISQNIQEDDLQHLQFFTEYGRLALLEGDEKEAPFQKLQFLVRDWSFPYDAEYGFEGGKQILNQRLQIADYQQKELQSLRKHINNCFGCIDAFLMPHPGLEVATNSNFDGSITDIDPLFIYHLEEFVPILLSPKNVLPRRINGSEIKCKDLCQYLRAYINVFKSNHLPQAKSILEATSEANNLASLLDAKSIYTNQMEKVCGGDKPSIIERTLYANHVKAQDKALEAFDKTKKMGGEKFSFAYRTRLKTEIQEEFEKCKLINESKSVLKLVVKTPIGLIVFILVSYLVSELFGIVGVHTLSNLFNGFFLAGVIIMLSWIYITFSGQLTEIGRYIDLFVAIIWNLFLYPLKEKIVSKTTNILARQAAQNLTSHSAVSSVTSMPNFLLQDKKHN